MAEAEKAQAGGKPQADGNKTVAGEAAAKPRTRTVSHPREVAALVLTQIDQVNTKKDELTLAIKALTDLTKQLATAYANQALAIEQLTRRVKALEGKKQG
jgi:methyl-accepting chemotaxis protein